MMTTANLALVVLSQSIAAPPPGCMQDGWGDNLIARKTLDLEVSQIRHTARQDGDAELEQVATELLLGLRDQNTDHLLETASEACLRHWVATRFEVRSAFSILVRHSLSEPDGSTQMAERALGWFEALHADGQIDAVSVGGLRDRILIHTDGVQLYGTHRACIDGQWAYDPPLSDPDNLEARRDALNWPQAARPPMGGACDYR